MGTIFSVITSIEAGEPLRDQRDTLLLMKKSVSLRKLALLLVPTEEKSIPITTSKKGTVSNRVFEGTLVLGPMDAELIP